MQGAENHRVKSYASIRELAADSSPEPKSTLHPYTSCEDVHQLG